jgi:hypothetical protein
MLMPRPPCEIFSHNLALQITYSIDARIQVTTISVANKREQICEAIPRITTPLIFVADDDIELPPKSLPHILAHSKTSRLVPLVLVREYGEDLD